MCNVESEASRNRKRMYRLMVVVGEKIKNLPNLKLLTCQENIDLSRIYFEKLLLENIFQEVIHRKIHLKEKPFENKF
jgi:hypothetical protein